MTSGVRWSREQVVSEASNATRPTKCAMRNAECGMVAARSAKGARPCRTPRSAFRIGLLAQRKQVREQPVRPRDAGRELAEECERGVHVGPLPHVTHQQPAPQR